MTIRIVTAILVLMISAAPLSSALARKCFPGLGSRVEYDRCRKEDVLQGFPTGEGNTVPNPQTPENGTGPGPQTEPETGRTGPTEPMPVQSFTIYPGHDLYGGDYARSRPGVWFTREQCRDTCKNESTCVAFTYDEKHGVCFFKDRLPDHLTVWPGAWSGVRSNQPRLSVGSASPGGGQTQGFTSECGSGFTALDNMDSPGGDIAGYKVGLQGCRAICLGNTRCVAFAWIKYPRVSKECWIKYTRRGPYSKPGVLTCFRQ